VHPVPIKLPRAVADKQLAIVTANKEAFYSYGLEQSFIAPTCRDCAASYANALNALARSKQNSLVMGGAIFLYWTREDVGFDLMALFDKPDPESVRLLLESTHSGKQSATIDETAFYATSLSGSGARVVVRDWIDTTVGEVQANLRRWFAWQRIVNTNGEEARALGMFQLADATVRIKSDGRADRDAILPTIPQALLNAALRGTPLPWSLLYQAVRRNRAEQRVTSQRAALIKLVFASRQSAQQEDRMAQLDTENTNQAYLCGRLLAVLEDVQRAAIPGAKATIVDRFFGTASSAPASVFGRLMRGAQPHLSKLERDNPNAYRALQRRMEEVVAGLGNFPRTLTLEEQGLFSLGYYHQRAHNRAEAKAASERKKASAVEAAVGLDATTTM
jgi:CRISPR-associated protein Csd1